MPNLEDLATLLVPAVAGLISLVVAAVGNYLRNRTRAVSRVLEERYQAAATDVLETVEQLQPERPSPSLEDEIAEVSGTLATTVTRLRDLSAKAQAYEAEVRELVKRADAAQATAQLNEEQARGLG
ncbi:hypothetical protein [Micromonospora sp. NPDC003776]